jgi:hypothetical protein
MAKKSKANESLCRMCPGDMACYACSAIFYERENKRISVEFSTMLKSRNSWKMLARDRMKELRSLRAKVKRLEAR